jgi:hypothetical protein
MKSRPVSYSWGLNGSLLSPIYQLLQLILLKIMILSMTTSSIMVYQSLRKGEPLKLPTHNLRNLKLPSRPNMVHRYHGPEILDLVGSFLNCLLFLMSTLTSSNNYKDDKKKAIATTVDSSS